MYWATVGHIGNDALGLALSVWFFGACARFSGRPSLAGAVGLALATSLGLLAKAYFLPLLVPAACLVAYYRVRALPAFCAVVALVAGPWYVRNLVLYHNLSGLLMASTGITPGRMLSSLAHVDWFRTIPYMLRATLWTGNNSFTSFPALTLNCLLALLAVGAVVYAVQAMRRGATSAESSVLIGVAVYAAAVILVVGNDVILLNGTSAGAAPWYTEVLLPPGLSLAFLGLSRYRRIGLPASIAILLIWTYLCCRHIPGQTDSLVRGVHQGPHHPQRYAGVVPIEPPRIDRYAGHRQPGASVGDLSGNYCGDCACTGHRRSGCSLANKS